MPASRSPSAAPDPAAPPSEDAHPAASRSLEEVHRTIRIPISGSWWRRLFAFAGPAYMVSVGYMDPGNWATDLEGGSKYGYRLIWVLLMSNLMAILLQTLSARLGLVTGRDLAQACRDSYGPAVRWALFVLCEIAIAACDLAEVIGSAIGLNLLFHIPLTWAVLITGCDVLLLLVIQRFGVRKMEAFIIVLISTIGACFILELLLSKPSIGGIASGFVPHVLGGNELYVAIGILGATVMPHNLYLHSSLVQSRDVAQTEEGLRQACRWNMLDSAIALNLAFFVNAAILIVAAAAFATRGVQVEGVQDAHRLLSNLLGSKAAPIAFAVALICAGQSSTVTGTLAGQITMEGFLHFRLRPWLRRLITRSLAIVPAIIVIGLSGERGVERLLVLSQVILSLQLPFAVVPLVRFTSSRRRMGPFATPGVWAVVAWVVAAIILALNAKLASQQIAEWYRAAGHYGWLVMGTLGPAALGMVALLVWMVIKPDEGRANTTTSAADVYDAAAALVRNVRRIGVALEAVPGDAAMLADAIALAKAHGAALVLMHVVEGVGGQWYGSGTADLESRHDDDYLQGLAERIRRDGVSTVRCALGYGDVRKQLVQLAKRELLDLLIVGGHGHRGLADILRGQTIDGVRHGVGIPVLAVRNRP